MKNWWKLSYLFSSKQQLIYRFKCKLAGMEKELEVLWKFEKRGEYLTGLRTKIITLEKKIAITKKKLELLEL